MKIIDIFLIAALLISFTLAGAFLNQVVPQQSLPVFLSADDRPMQRQEFSEMRPKPASNSVSIKDVPGAQVVVGLFCLVFGTITFLPLLIKNDRKDEA